MKNIIFIKPILFLLLVFVSSCKEHSPPPQESVRGPQGQQRDPQGQQRDPQQSLNNPPSVIEPVSLSFSLNPASILKKGQKAELKVIALDASGKQIPRGGLDISLLQTSLEGHDHVDFTALIDHQDGSYTTQVTAKNVGRFSLDAIIRSSGLRVKFPSPIVVSGVIPQSTSNLSRHGVPYVEEVRQVFFPDPCNSFPSYCIPDPGVNLKREGAMIKLGATPDKTNPNILRANLSNGYYVTRDETDYWVFAGKKTFRPRLHWPDGSYQAAGYIEPSANFQNKCSKHYRKSDKTDQDVINAIMNPANGIVTYSTERMTWERWGKKEFEDRRIGMDPPFDLKYVINFAHAVFGAGLYVASNPVSSTSYAERPPNDGLVTVVAPANAPLIDSQSGQVFNNLRALGFTDSDIFKDCPIPALIAVAGKDPQNYWWTLKTHRVEKSPGVWENLIIKDFTGEYYPIQDLFRFKKEILAELAKGKIQKYAYDTYWAKIQKTLSKRVYNPKNPSPVLPLTLTAVHPLVTPTHPDGKNWTTVPELAHLDPNKFVSKTTKPEYFWRFDGSCGKYYLDGEILGEDFVPVQNCIDNHAPTASAGGFGGSLCLNKAQTLVQGGTPTCDYLLDLGLGPKDPITASYGHQGSHCLNTTPQCPL